MGISDTIYIGSNGQKIVTCIPGTYVIINTDATASQPGASDRNVCYIGEAYAGECNTLRNFSDEIEAEKELLGGDLYEAVRKGFVGSPDFRPTKLFTMQPGSNTQAYAILQNASAANQIKVYAKLWGTPGNLNTIAVSAGTLANSNKITMRYPGKSDEVIDNILYEALTITTTNGSTTATVTITATGLTTQLDGSGTDIDISFTEANTLKKLVDAINAHSGYTATLIGSPEMLCEYLDNFTDEDIKSTTTLSVTANVQYTIDLLNRYAVLIEKAEFVGTARTDIATLAETAFTGGTNPTVDSTAWDTMFTALEKEDIQGVVCADTSQTIILKLKEFIDKMWTQQYKRFSIGFVGSNTNDTKSTKFDLARTLDSKNMVLFASNVYDNDRFGREEEQNGRDLAAKAGGIMASTPINEPLTFKAFEGLRLAEELSPNDLSDYIKAGIVMLRKSDVSGKIICARSVTTYQGTNLQLNEYSIVRTQGWITRDRYLTLQAHLELPNKDRKNLPVDLKSKDLKKLNDYKNTGILATDPNGQKQTIEYHTIEQIADAFIIKSKVLVSVPDNFVFIDTEFTVI